MSNPPNRSQPDGEGKDWHADHSHGGNGMGWGGLFSETSHQNISVVKEWTGKKSASVRSVRNSDGA